MSPKTTSSSPQPPIPFIYRLMFTYVDPLFCLLGSYQHLLAQASVLSTYSAGPGIFDTLSKVTSTSNQVSIPTAHILTNLSSVFVLLFVLEAILLRARKDDVTVWRIVQLGGFAVDAIMVFAAVEQLTAEGRLMDVNGWGGDEWYHVVGNAGMGVLRLACALGLGMNVGGRIKGD